MRQLKIKQQVTNRTGEAINRYFQDISKYPMISAEEETELTVRIRNGDQVALDKLVLSNLRFVVSVAKQYQNQGLSFSDLINEGNVGLVKAAKKFDETRGFKFISYAVWWIRQSIIQAISEHTRIVRLPLNRLSTINKISKAIPYLEQQFERVPSIDEIANYLEINDQEIDIANNIKKKHLSFDMPISNDADSDYSLLDVVHTDNIPTPDNNLIQESIISNMDRVIKKLTKRESEIIIMFYGLNNSKVYSLREIGDFLNLTTERVRQIKDKSLIKLKSILKRNYSLYNI